MDWIVFKRFDFDDIGVLVCEYFVSFWSCDIGCIFNDFNIFEYGVFLDFEECFVIYEFNW